MTAPVWMNAVIGDFGRAAGAPSLALNGRGAARLDFENGASLRLEYTGSELVVAVTVPARGGMDALKRLLSHSHPESRDGIRVRTGILERSGAYVAAVRLAERDVTLPRLNAAFAALWRLADEIGGAA
ncbi:MAG: hypothetical protein J6U17_00410 [Kiritimatiellae bacterium]|nr:hypothetical protein [Kiritimatiellia bacterium]